MTDETPETIVRGAKAPLKYTPSARHRVICAVNWDAKTDKAGFRERFRNKGLNVDTWDVDLGCVMYDAKGNAVDGVSGKPDETADRSGKIYHTGDDTTGTGDLDDEQISIELKDLPDYIHHIVFVVEIQSAHKFGDLGLPSARIADGSTDENQLEATLDRPEGANKDAYVFARIYRGESGWMLHFIDQFADGAKIQDWIPVLKKFLA